MSTEINTVTGLSGARVLVTGGTRGIGAATARLLARAGADVGGGTDGALLARRSRG